MGFSGGSNTGGAITAKLQLLGSREFASQADHAAAAARRVGTGVHDSGKQAERASGGFTLFGKRLGTSVKQADGGALSFRRLGKSILGMGAAFIGFRAAEQAVTTTTSLAKSTKNLATQFNMTTNEAGQWAATAEVYHLSSQKMSMGLTKLSLNYEQAVGGNAKAQAAFRSMGITMDQLRGTGGNVNNIMALVAGNFENISQGAKRGAIGQMLLGKGYASMIPLLRNHGQNLAHIQHESENLFGDKSLEDISKMIAAEKESALATLQLKIAFGTELAPGITRATKAMSQFIKDAKENKGVAGALLDVYKATGTAIGKVIEFLDKHQDVAKGLIWTVVGLTGAIKVYNIALAVCSMGSTVVSGVIGGYKLIRGAMVATAVTAEASAAVVAASNAAMGAGLLGGGAAAAAGRGAAAAGGGVLAGAGGLLGSAAVAGGAGGFFGMKKIDDSTSWFKEHPIPFSRRDRARKRREEQEMSGMGSQYFNMINEPTPTLNIPTPQPAGDKRPIVVHSHISINGKEIGNAVATNQKDVAARR